MAVFNTLVVCNLNLKLKIWEVDVVVYTTPKWHGFETWIGPYDPTEKTSNRSFLRFF